MNFFKNLTTGGKVIFALIIGALIFGFKWGYDKYWPKEVKKANIVSAANIPPLAYDKAANAVFRKVPEFNEPVDIQAPEMRGGLMGWNAQSGLMYAVGGTVTSKGSIAEELGLNIKLLVQNNCSKQAEELYAFTQEFASGNPNPTKGYHFIAWMGDGVPAYFSSLVTRCEKDFGPEYIPQVIYFGGASFGEDKWLLKQKYAKNPLGSLTVTVIRDGDWNIAVLNAKQRGLKINFDHSTYDPDAVNFIPAPNDDYMEAAKFYVAGQKVTLRLVKNGRYTGKDTTLAATGVATWFPGDFQAVKEKGGLVTVASTKDYGGQMANAIIFCKKWAADNRPLIEKFIEAVGRGGDQVKSHDEALRFAAKVSQLVYADQNMTDEDWYNAFKSYDVTDDDGNTVNIGGSRVFNLADAAAYTGISGGRDTYKSVYNTFGRFCVEGYPEVIASYPEYEKVTDWSYLRAVYNRNKSTAGTVSKADIKSTDRITKVVADGSYSIEFETGSSTIKPSSYKLLDQLSDQLSIADNLVIEIMGHTDNTGDDKVNIPLSEARAKAVKEYFAKEDAEVGRRITSYKGYGSTRPKDPNANQNDPAVRATNRRVEIKIGRN